MKIINITHTDLDGIGCSVVLGLLFPNHELQSYYCSYHDVEQKISDVLDNLTDDVQAVYITDISFREESGLAERIESANNKRGRAFIRLFDHHATSGYLNKYNWAWSHEKDLTTGELKCGTQWTCDILRKEYFIPINPSFKEFVRLVNLWDTWRWVTDYPTNEPHVESSWLNMVFSTYGKKKFLDVYLQKIRNNTPIFDVVENTIIECKLQDIESDVTKKDKEMIVRDITYATKRSQLKFIKNYLESNHMDDKDYLLDLRYSKVFKVGIIYLDRNVSDVSNKLAEMHPELDFILSINIPKTVSLRSVKDLDVPLGIVANYITGKGGGHPKSAGGVLKPDTDDKVWKTIERTIYHRT